MTDTADKSKSKISPQHSESTNYTQGHSNYTISTHQTRTAESDAAFLLPHIKKTDHILDVGCGPGTITTGLAKYASSGTTIGVDISLPVLETAKAHAAASNTPTQGPGSVAFEPGNVLVGLRYADDTFDVVFCSQLFGHLQAPHQPRAALAELRRVLKPAGLLATRDGAAHHFFPPSVDLDRLWVRNQGRAFGKGAPDADATGTVMPALMRSVGFDADAGKVRVGAGTTVYAGAETRRWLAWRAAGQLREGDAVRRSWVEAGIGEEEIEETLVAVGQWAEREDAWYAALQCEMLAWK